MDHGNRPERESGDEDYPVAPLPPHERVWRHPSELGTGHLVPHVTHDPAPAISRSLVVGTALASLVVVAALTRLMVPGDADDDVAVRATASTARASAPLVATTLIATTAILPPTSSALGSEGSVATDPSSSEPAATASSALASTPPATDPGTQSTAVSDTTGPTASSSPSSEPSTSPSSAPTSVAPTSSVTGDPATTVADPALTVPPPQVALLALAGGSRPAFAVEVQAGALYVTTSAAVGDAASTSLLLDDGDTMDADVVMVDEVAGIAVLQVDTGPSEGDPPASLRSAGGASPGQEVTVLVEDRSSHVKGVIGQGTGAEGAQELLADEPVGEGAPVLDDEGNLVGICTASGETSWVVPAAALNAAIAASTSLSDGGGWLGVSGERGEDGGVLVAAVVSGSPADAAGIVARDLIVAVDGRAVRSLPELALDLADHAPGDEVTLTVQRDGTTLELAVTLASRPA